MNLKESADFRFGRHDMLTREAISGRKYSRRRGRPPLPEGQRKIKVRLTAQQRRDAVAAQMRATYLTPRRRAALVAWKRRKEGERG